MSSEYHKAWTEYQRAAVAAANGDGEAKKAKAALMGDIRKIERAAAREGRSLSAIKTADGNIKVETKDGGDTKRSLQEAYVRKFDDENEVELGGRKTTLRKYHAKRLLNK